MYIPLELLDRFVADIKDEDYLTGLTAVYALGEIGDPRAIEPLIEVIDQFPQVHFLVSDALQKFGDLAFEPLIKALKLELTAKNKNSWRYGDILQQLKGFGEKTSLYLLEFFQEGDIFVKNCLLYTLAQFNSQIVVETLLTTLRQEIQTDNLELVETAAYSLSHLEVATGNNQITEAIASIKNWEILDWHIIRYLFSVLAKVGTTEAIQLLVNLLEKPVSDLSRNPELVETLGIKDNLIAVNYLIKLFFENSNSQVQKATLKSLVRIGSTSADLLRQAISQTHDDLQRCQLNGVLLLIGDKQALEPLLNFLGHSNPKIRRQAVKTLQGIKSSEIIEPLIKALYDEDEKVRGAVLDVIEEYPDKRFFWPLIDKLTDEALVSSVISTIKYLEDKRVVPYLLPYLQHSDEDVRTSTSGALELCGDERAVEPLTKCLTDEIRLVRDFAAIALWEIGDKRAIKPLLQAMEAEVVTDELSARTKGFMIAALGKLGAEEIIEPVINLLNAEDKGPREREEDWELRLFIVYALVQLGHRLNLEIFENSISQLNKKARLRATFCLERLCRTEYDDGQQLAVLKRIAADEARWDLEERLTARVALLLCEHPPEYP